MAVLEYAHLNVKVDLQRAIGEVKEACENIQWTTEHVRRKVEGLDIHSMMQRQEKLCMSFAQDMHSQLYALGKEIHVRGIPDPFDMSRGKGGLKIDLKLMVKNWPEIGKKMQIFY